MPSEPIEPLFRCADCGRSLTLRRGKWAHVEPDDDGWGTRYVFTCRTHTRAMPSGKVRLEAVDYHYVEGETRRRFYATEVGRDN